MRHAQTVRTTIANVVADSLNEGGLPGTLVFLTTGNVAVATLTLSVKACGDAALGIAVFNEIERDRNAVGGLIAKFSIRNSSGVEKISGSASLKGGDGDIQMDTRIKDLNVEPGQTVRQSSMRYTAPL